VVFHVTMEMVAGVQNITRNSVLTKLGS